MKKALIHGLLLVALAVTVKAQNQPLNPVKPNNQAKVQDLVIKVDTRVDSLVRKWVKELNKVPVNDLNKLANDNSNQSNGVIYSNMPVVGKQDSNYNMPVAKPGDANTKYTLLVKRIDIIDVVKKARTIDPGVKF